MTPLTTLCVSTHVYRYDYEEPYRSDILDLLFKPNWGAAVHHMWVLPHHTHIHAHTHSLPPQPLLHRQIQLPISSVRSQHLAPSCPPYSLTCIPLSDPCTHSSRPLTLSWAHAHGLGGRTPTLAATRMTTAKWRLEAMGRALTVPRPRTCTIVMT